jgi:hypothetical protein
VLRGKESGRGRVNEEGKRRVHMLMYFLCRYEYGTLKPVEVTLRQEMW